MFDFFIRKGLVQSAQRFIDRLNPPVQIHIHPEAPLPSISLVKRLSITGLGNLRLGRKDQSFVR